MHQIPSAISSCCVIVLVLPVFQLLRSFFRFILVIVAAAIVVDLNVVFVRIFVLGSFLVVGAVGIVSIVREVIALWGALAVCLNVCCPF